MKGVTVLDAVRTVRRGAVLGLFALLAACGEGPPPDDLVEGRFFPPLLLHDFEGNTRSITDYRGRLVVLNVWATWCPPCRKELPSLQRLQARLGEERYAVIGLSVDSDPDIAQEYLLERGITFENFLDVDAAEARRLLGIRAYPDTFIISPEGVLLRSIVGDREWDDPEIARAIEAAFHGQTEGLRRI